MATTYTVVPRRCGQCRWACAHMLRQGHANARTSISIDWNKIFFFLLLLSLFEQKNVDDKHRFSHRNMSSTNASYTTRSMIDCFLFTHRSMFSMSFFSSSSRQVVSSEEKKRFSFVSFHARTWTSICTLRTFVKAHAVITLCVCVCVCVLPRAATMTKRRQKARIRVYSRVTYERFSQLNQIVIAASIEEFMSILDLDIFCFVH
jgi:hypothetical protein